jgi:hypothetical protein
VAAEYEVNIKLNSKEIETQLGQIDRKIAKIGKPKGGSSGKRAGIAGLLPSSTELKAAERGLTQLTAKTKNIQSIQDKFSERRIRALTRSNSLNEKELRLNRQLTNEARQRLRLLSQSGAKGFDATRPQGRQMSENINALVNAQEKRARLANKINEMEAKGLNVDKLRKQLGKATTEQSARRFASATKEFRLLEKTIRLEESKLRILKQQQQGFASSPIRGGANMPGSPLARRARNKRLEQVGLGAGFPLLFGGGAGSVIGGGLGGLTGSFGAQIALSAIGQQVDQFIASMVNAGKAFGSLGETLNLMRERSLFTSKESEELARQLEELGDVEGLAELATIELASKIGSEGIGAFQDLETEVDEFDRLVGHLMISLQAFLAGPLGDFLEVINATLGKKVTQGTIDRLAGSLQDPADRTRFRAAAKERIGTELEIQGFGMGGLPRSAEVLKSAPLDLLSELSREVAGGKFGESNLLSRPLRITRQDRETTKPKKDRAGRDAERLAKRLAGLDAERAKLEQLLQLDQQINTAKLEGDNRQIIALENEARLLQFAEKEAVIRASKVPQEQKIAELRNLSLERDRALLENAFRLDSFDKQKADDLTLQLEQLDLQLEAATAITREAENQAKLELLLLNLRESNKDLTEDQLQELMNKTKQLFEAQNQGPLQSFITQSVKSLNDLEAQAVQVSQNIGNALGNSIVSGLRNLVTGAESAKKVFADMLMSFADVLAKQAAQMIATYIAIGIARAFAGMGSGGGETTPPTTMPGASVQTGGGLNINGVDQFIAPPTLASSGGYFGGPTNAVVGEGGQGEYVIPESKMRESMARYSRGARGSAVIPDSGVSGTSGEDGGVAVAAPIDVRYTVERINSVDYVTADQFQAGMRQAANQGAKQGEQQTLRRLQMSSSTRKRIGM